MQLHGKFNLVCSCQDSLGTTQHRFAILISGGPDYKQGKLLAIPTLPDGTGQSQARAIVDALDDWKAAEGIVGLCYDTTASNTDRIQGAVVRVEQELGRRLLHLECRHHVLELIIGAVGQKLFGKTTGPSDKKFLELKKRYEYSYTYYLLAYHQCPDYNMFIHLT